MKYLLDSNILIYYLNGDEIIRSFLQKNKSECVISSISYYEVLNYNFSKQEEKIIIDFLQTFVIIDVSMQIINQSLINRKIKKLKMADNFILATAQTSALQLITRNTKDFPNFPMLLLNPFNK